MQVSALVVNGTGAGTGSPVKIDQAGILDTGTNVLLLPSKVLKEVEQVMCVGSEVGTTQLYTCTWYLSEDAADGAVCVCRPAVV